ncbi:Linoleate 13s-lipoxygenase 2-1 protein [Thalictrum thalictroides]|uniref:Lipoxygenase n=1 Tax=Thalictrum thalictroides TaxID=46969 RepID=A0A7J6WB78_THATH|nr:Linoleate 13s-lipoxygenase 2-1 protein [Thalictrum thalictroides]
MVENEHHKEMYLNNIVLADSLAANDTVTIITCNSWVHSKFDDPNMRVFFTNKSYLPSETPSGIRKLREKQLENLRGNGEGERKSFERIYDYDVYNDIGNPDKSVEMARPVLGGPQHPYPRRCRTGRGSTNKDPLSEKTSGYFYVPRDEAFSGVKGLTFSAKTFASVLKAVIPSLETALVDAKLGFPYFTKIDSLFDEGIPIPEDQARFKSMLPRLIKAVVEGQEHLLLFEPPEIINRDKFSWFRDEEFCRQTLAGLNPYCIQLVTEWPMKSKLDPSIYGPPQSAITKEIVEREIKGIMTLEEAMERKKLFVLDYHDILLPYVEKVRELEGTTLYGSRTLLFQTEDSTLRPIAIELTRPPIGNKPQWRHVYTPCWDATNSWLWKFAKSHATAHDSGYHQLVSHWLRTHCCMEPYIIAANRQLSVMHPIYRFLHPHFRYTMEINALAREALINADGIIESCFFPGKYSMELSSVAYDKLWRFDMEALPADLIRRGMAVEDPTAEHGVKLTIEDYPFANDGLVLWDAIKSWVTDYVNHYYLDANAIETDTELQAWWTEVRTKGHGDKKDEPWWPVLNTADSLIQTLTTIIWVGSGHHAAVNFGQYAYAGYFPNRPTIARTNMPNEDPTEAHYKKFLSKPEAALLECFPSQIQATKVMAILDVLSNHSPDEEYIGETMEASWSEDPIIKAAYEIFGGKLKELEGIIDARNADPKLKNRNGAGVVPYELLKPVSVAGVTGMGVPNSVSI